MLLFLLFRYPLCISSNVHYNPLVGNNIGNIKIKKKKSCDFQRKVSTNLRNGENTKTVNSLLLFLLSPLSLTPLIYRYHHVMTCLDKKHQKNR